MDRAALEDRKLDVMTAAAKRWQGAAPDLAVTAERLRRGGPRAAATPERHKLFLGRIHAVRLDPGRLGDERLMGPDDMQDYPPNDVARRAGRPVARLVEIPAPDRVGDGFATAFLVAPRLLLTNWHVFPTAAYARSCGAQFGFERGDSGLYENGVVFELDASFFYSDEALDLALVGLKDTPLLGQATLANFGSVPLIASLGKVLAGHPINIIQHAGGRHKQWAVRENKLLLQPKDSDLFLTYTTDTLEGSSGSPAFSDIWELVAVHHSGVPRRVNGNIMTRTNTVWRKGMSDSDIDWVANEGVRVSKLCAWLKQLQPGSEAHRVRLDELSARTDAAAVGPEAVLIQPSGSSVQNSGGREHMNVVVNGTANFYLCCPPAPATQPTPALQLPPQPGVGVEKKLVFDQDYDNRPGYGSTFLDGFDIPPPKAPAGVALQVNGADLILDYHHYSLVMHKKRRLAIWTAANADYHETNRRYSRKEFGTDTWKPDPRILITAQIEDVEFYAPAAKFDRGHLVRRDDVAWGETEEEEEYGNSDSFHWTNCTPQHEGFNRDMFEYKGLWGQLENHITKQAGYVDQRLILFAGPILDEADKARDFGSGVKVKVPIAFWKVVVAVETVGDARTRRAYGFVLDQSEAIREYGWEGRFRVGKFKENQESLARITELSGVVFDQMLHDADPMAGDPNEGLGRSLAALDQIKLR